MVIYGKQFLFVLIDMLDMLNVSSIIDKIINTHNIYTLKINLFKNFYINWKN